MTDAPDGPSVADELSLLRVAAARMQLQLATLGTAVEPAQRQLLLDWYDTVTNTAAATGHGGQLHRLAVGMSFTTDLSEVSWRVSGPTEHVLAGLGAAFDQVGASASGRRRFEQVGANLRPGMVGMEVQVGLPGIDAAWFVPEHVSLRELSDLGVPAGVVRLLELHDAVLLEGGLGPVPYIGVTTPLDLGHGDLAEALVAHFTSYGHRPPSAALVVALGETHRGQFLRSEWFDDKGQVKQSVVAVDPELATLLAVSTASGGAGDEALAECIATLGSDRPRAIELESWADGERARVHVDVRQSP